MKRKDKREKENRFFTWFEQLVLRPRLPNLPLEDFGALHYPSSLG